jgi:hypothetical protein
MLSSTREKRALRTLTSIASRFNVRDDRDTPLFIEAGRGKIITTFRKTEAEYFWREGLTYTAITSGKTKWFARRVDFATEYGRRASFVVKVQTGHETVI